MKLSPLLILSILAAPITANSAVIDFNFSGVFSSITYSRCTNLADGTCDAWDHTYPSSAQLPDTNSVSLGDSFVGSLRYETTTPLSGISEDGSQAVHLDGVTEFSSKIGAFALPTLDLPKAGFGNFSVINDRNGRDSFYISQWFSGEDWFSTISISLFDWSGTAYSDFTVPTSFLPDQFDTTRFSIGFLRRADGDQVHLSGNLSTYTSSSSSIASVPEPSVLLLAALGLPLLASRRFRSRAS